MKTALYIKRILQRVGVTFATFLILFLSPIFVEAGFDLEWQSEYEVDRGTLFGVPRPAKVMAPYFEGDAVYSVGSEKLDDYPDYDISPVVTSYPSMQRNRISDGVLLWRKTSLPYPQPFHYFSSGQYNGQSVYPMPSNSVVGVAYDASSIYYAIRAIKPSTFNGGEDIFYRPIYKSYWQIEKRSKNTGVLLWEQQRSFSPASTPLTDEIGTGIYVDTSGLYIAGLQATTTDSSLSDPLDDSSYGYMTRVEKYDLTTGAPVWSNVSGITFYNTIEDVTYLTKWSTPSIFGDSSGLYVSHPKMDSDEPPKIEKRNLLDGSVLWSQTYPAYSDISPLEYNDSSYAYYYTDTGFMKVDKSDGSQVWSSSNIVSAVAQDNEYLYGAYGIVPVSYVYAINKNTGVVDWSQEVTPNPLYAGALRIAGLEVVDDRLFMQQYSSTASGDEYLSETVVLQKNDGEIEYREEMLPNIIPAKNVRGFSADGSNIYMFEDGPLGLGAPVPTVYVDDYYTYNQRYVASVIRKFTYVPPTATLTTPDCFIAENQSTCTVTSTWTSTSSLPDRFIYIDDVLSTAPLAEEDLVTGVDSTIGYGSHQFEFRDKDGARVLDGPIMVVADCEPGLVWGGGFCQTPKPNLTIPNAAISGDVYDPVNKQYTSVFLTYTVKNDQPVPVNTDIPMVISDAISDSFFTASIAGDFEETRIYVFSGLNIDVNVPYTANLEINPNGDVDVVELDYADNEFDADFTSPATIEPITFTLLPPDPGLVLTGQTVVPRGATAKLNWNTGTADPAVDVCKIVGPGIDPADEIISTNTGEFTTIPLTTTAIYTLTCQVSGIYFPASRAVTVIIRQQEV